MPGPDTNNEGRDYVVLGKISSWSLAPKSLTIEGMGTREVAKETYDYMSRGWKLEDGSLNGTVELEDGSTIPVTIKVSTCC